MPVAVDQRMLVAQHFQHGGILCFGELVRVFDTQLRLGRFDEQRRIGDINRAVIGLHASLIGFTVRQILFGKDDAPAVRRRREGFGVVHQQVWPPLVRRAVDFTADVKPFPFHNPLVEGFPVGDKIGVNRLDAFAHDQPQGGIA